MHTVISIIMVASGRTVKLLGVHFLKPEFKPYSAIYYLRVLARYIISLSFGFLLLKIEI